MCVFGRSDTWLVGKHMVVGTHRVPNVAVEHCEKEDTVKFK
jgi:hypothetical protein